MRNLICWCPETQQPINLQIYTDYATLARIWSNLVRFQCPQCGAEHETKVGAACLQTTLGRTASNEAHEAPARRAVSGDNLMQGGTNVAGTLGFDPAARRPALAPPPSPKASCLSPAIHGNSKGGLVS
jgi:hypothetical protein